MSNIFTRQWFEMCRNLSFILRYSYFKFWLSRIYSINLNGFQVINLLRMNELQVSFKLLQIQPNGGIRFRFCHLDPVIIQNMRIDLSTHLSILINWRLSIFWMNGFFSVLQASTNRSWSLFCVLWRWFWFQPIVIILFASHENLDRLGSIEKS